MTTTAAPLVLDVQGQAIPLPPGARLMATVLPMLAPSTMGGPVAQVAANPSDPAQLGLQNLTSQPWPARMPDGTERQVLPGQTLRLAEGVMLSWGGIIVQVRSALAPTAPQPPAQPPFGQPQWQAPQAAPNGWQGGQGGPIRPGQTPLAAPNGSLGMSQLMPLLSKTSRPRLLALIAPGLIIATLTALLFAKIGSGMPYIDTLAIVLLMMMLTIVYQLCGKKKPWWVFLITAVTTMILMVVFMAFGYFFNTPDNLAGYLIVGMREEFLKSIPVFIGLLLGLLLGKSAVPPAPGRQPGESWAARVGVLEPLDGILIAAASATGFTCFETLTQYVPNIMKQAGEAAGVELLVPRIMNEICGHIAWAGCFGYFIGLTALKPKRWYMLLPIGWGMASVLHALWDTYANNVPMMILLGALNFLCFAAAVVQARQLSPGRAMNFATQINRAP